MSLSRRKSTELTEPILHYLRANDLLVGTAGRRALRILHISPPEFRTEEPAVCLFQLKPQYELQPYVVGLGALRNAVLQGVWTPQSAQEPPAVPLSDRLRRPGQSAGAAARKRWNTLATELPEGVCLLTDARLLMRGGRGALLQRYAEHLKVKPCSARALLRWAWQVGATRYAAGALPPPYTPTPRSRAPDRTTIEHCHSEGELS